VNDFQNLISSFLS